MVSYGVGKVKNAAAWLQVFKFGKTMGIENIVCEPDEKDLSLLSKLCDEYKINVAIHNHPKPSHYWNPDVLLAAIQGQSKRIGTCAYIGHWVRSSLYPVEWLKN